MAIENITGNETVEELQQSYALVENRLRILDEKRSYTKPEIYQKVRAEYEAKLFELRVMLEEKGAGLQEALDAAISERESRVARHHQLKDELEELELRAVIGELDETSFAQKQQAMQEEMAGIDAALEELSAKIENYQQMLGGQTAPAVQSEVIEEPAHAEPEPAVEPEPAPEPEVVIPLAPAAPLAPQRPAHQPVPRPMPAVRPSTPEPAPPAAVSQRPAPPIQPPVPPRQAAPVPKPAPVAAPEPQLVQPVPAAHRAAPAPQPAPPVQQPPSVTTPAPATQPSNTEMDELERQFASILSSTMADSAPLEKPAMEEVFTQSILDAAEPAGAEPAPAEDSHDGELKCPKCGAFNRADNWYCEKCGNELLNASDLLGGTK